MPRKESLAFILLVIATAAVFAGRGWQHIFLDAPYRALLWDQNIMEPFISGWANTNWEDYVGDIKVDRGIQNGIKVIGFFYAIIALLVISIPKSGKKWLRPMLLVGASSLIFLAFLYSKERFYQAPQFWEYSLQFSTPIFLFWWLVKEKWGKSMILGMKIAIALTFIAHGLYAAGVYPRPAHFTEMTMTILGLSEIQTGYFLQGIAVADFVASVLIFFQKPLSTIGLVYCIIWGFLTTIARFWGNFNVDWLMDTMQQWLYESIYRFPHFIIPLIVLILSTQSKKLNTEKD